MWQTNLLSQKNDLHIKLKGITTGNSKWKCFTYCICPYHLAWNYTFSLVIFVACHRTFLTILFLLVSTKAKRGFSKPLLSFLLLLLSPTKTVGLSSRSLPSFTAVESIMFLYAFKFSVINHTLHTVHSFNIWGVFWFESRVCEALMCCSFST